MTASKIYWQFFLQPVKKLKARSINVLHSWRGVLHMKLCSLSCCKRLLIAVKKLYLVHLCPNKKSICKCLVMDFVTRMQESSSPDKASMKVTCCMCRYCCTTGPESAKYFMKVLWIAFLTITQALCAEVPDNTVLSSYSCLVATWASVILNFRVQLQKTYQCETFWDRTRLHRWWDQGWSGSFTLTYADKDQRLPPLMEGGGGGHLWQEQETQSAQLSFNWTILLVPVDMLKLGIKLLTDVCLMLSTVLEKVWDILLLLTFSVGDYCTCMWGKKGIKVGY